MWLFPSHWLSNLLQSVWFELFSTLCYYLHSSLFAEETSNLDCKILCTAFVSFLGLAKPLTGDQQSFLKLLHKLLNSAPVDKFLEEAPTKDSDSTESLAEAMKRLFNMSSSPSLASANTSWHSVREDDSFTEAVRMLFDDSSSSTNLPKTNSYPATPCNSADNLPKKKTVKDTQHSTSMREVLKKLLSVGEGEKSAATSDSLWSLGDAMIKAFNEDFSTKDNEDKCNLSTSNDSLSEAMHWLFDTLSEHSLANSSSSDVKVSSDSSSSSLGSTIFWGLFNSTPEEYKDVDVKAKNKQKSCEKENCDAGGSVDCECLSKKSGQLANPSLSSVIRAASPDRDVDISFPSSGQKVSKASLLASKQQPKHEETKDASSSGTESSVFTFVSCCMLVTVIVAY